MGIGGDGRGGGDEALGFGGRRENDERRDGEGPAGGEDEGEAAEERFAKRGGHGDGRGGYDPTEWTDPTDLTDRQKLVGERDGEGGAVEAVVGLGGGVAEAGDDGDGVAVDVVEAAAG